MKQSSSELLEFDALLALLGRFVSSELGRRELRQVAPSSDRAALEAIHRATAEAIEYVQTASRPQTTARGAAARIRFESLPDAEQAASKLAIEGVSLEAKEILDLTALLERASEIRMLLSASSERFPLLGRQALRIGEFRDLLRELSGKILPDGTAQTLAWASSYYLAAILANPIAAELNLGTAWVFVAFSSGLLAAGFLGPVSGRLIDRFGGHRVLPGSNLLFAIALASIGLANAPVSLICSAKDRLARSFKDQRMEGRDENFRDNGTR